MDDGTEDIEDYTTDSFISSSEEFEDELTWHSEDSRPPAPSPPASTDVTESPIGHRLRTHTYARRASVLSVSSDDDSVRDHLSSQEQQDQTNLQPFRRLLRSNSVAIQHNTESQSSLNVITDTSQESSYLSTGSEPATVVLSSDENSSDINLGTWQQSVFNMPVHPELGSTGQQEQQMSPIQHPPSLSALEPTLQNQAPTSMPVYPPSNVPVEVEPRTPNHPEPNVSVQEPRSPDHSPPQPVVVDLRSPDHPPPNVPVEVEPRTPDHPPTNMAIEVEFRSSESPGANPKALQENNVGASLNDSRLSDDGSLCSICMDPLTNSGDHRVVCLRCGHIFGQSCLQRWIKVGCDNGAKRCPTCNKRACLKDIRVLYLSKVVPLDTVERDRVIQEKENILMQKNMIEKELAKCKLQYDLNTKKYKDTISQLEKELGDTKRSLSFYAYNSITPNVDFKEVKTSNVKRTSLVHTIDITRDGGCRVFAYSPITNQMVVSQPSGNTLFAGFGVRELDIVGFEPICYIPLHSKMIRDLAFHPFNRSLLLSVSLDQTAKLLDLSSRTVVHTFKGDGPLWSCCWDTNNQNLMFTGSQTGKICQYDRRMAVNCVESWCTDNNTTPVVALAPVPSGACSPFPQGGFLSCRLNAIYAFPRHGNMYDCQRLEQSGPFMSMMYDDRNRILLTSARPSSSCPYARVSLSLVDQVEKGKIILPEIHTFDCGHSARVLSRLTYVPVANEDSVIIAHHDSARSLRLWHSASGDLMDSVQVQEPVIDLTNMRDSFFASLSEKKVCIYKLT